MIFLNQYELKQTNTNNEYFIGMNSGHGFIGTYDDLIDEGKLERVYIIKGAAGTGKSTLMKLISDRAEELGHIVARYYCSSDHDSLDCIMLDDKIAVLDGTSPHSREMVYPGAVSELVDLTKFWDNEHLIMNRPQIINATEKKRVSFETAYRLLHIVESLQTERYNSVSRCIDYAKMNKCISRLIKSFEKPDVLGKSNTCIIRSLGMKGRVRLDTFEKSADTIISVTDSFGSAYVFMTKLAEKLKESGFAFVTSPDPVSPSLICDVYIPSNSTLITVESCQNAERCINMKRFVNYELLSDLKGYIRLSVKCANAILDEAMESLERAAKCHFELEKIYGEAMNFESMTMYGEDLLRDILAKLS